MIIYVFCFALELGLIFWLSICEIYLLKVRGAAMSTATIANCIMNLIEQIEEHWQSGKSSWPL